MDAKRDDLGRFSSVVAEHPGPREDPTMNQSPTQFFAGLRWIDQRPLLDVIEPYRLALFERFFTERMADGLLRYNLGLFGRAKKNWKTSDLVFACLYALVTDGDQTFIVANDEGQAADDLRLAKRIIRANPALDGDLRLRHNVIERVDGEGAIEILPAQDAIGAHGKTYRLLAVDEVHGYRNWDLLEALAPDPTRGHCQQWITSYASIFHRPGAPLFDLLQQAKSGGDSRILFSWYAGNFTTDPDFTDKTPEARANPSMPSWNNPSYLAQQQRRLPAHKYRRLHLNLGGLPEGSAFQPEPVMDAVARGLRACPPEAEVTYEAFVDMSGGSNDDAVLAIGHKDPNDRAVIDRVLNQGPSPPFDPIQAVDRFVEVLREYRVASVTGDRYAGETFREAFRSRGVEYHVAEKTTSQHYEALEPRLNGHAVVLLDAPLLEQQLLGLVWRGGKIDHVNGEHDDWACAVAGLVVVLLGSGRRTYWDETSQCHRPDLGITI